jgi:hypothetical protein
LFCQNRIEPLLYLYSARGLARVAAIGLTVSATAQNSTVIVAPSAPPPPRIETMPPPPSGPQPLSWQSGHWGWNGSALAWDEGRYVQAPQAAAVWEPGHWQQQASGGYVWLDGRWRSQRANPFSQWS